MPAASDALSCNRVMLAHFDNYSAALFFAKWGRTLLWPESLPEGAVAMPAPEATADAVHGAEAVKAAVAERLKLNPDDLVLAREFDHWFHTESGPVRVHLLRLNTFEPPRKALEAHEGVFRQISELRGSARDELLLAREVFELMLGPSGGRV